MADIPTTSNSTMRIAASGLRAQQARMRVIAENLANANSTARTPDGDPYRRQISVFKPEMVDGGQGVRLAKVVADEKDFKTVYDPSHPAANKQGYVKMPNVDSLIEALDLREAQRAYEANLNVIETARSMEMRTLELLKK
jgi:flagellar basal-body rod protein FlgC